MWVALYLSCSQSQLFYDRRATDLQIFVPLFGFRVGHVDGPKKASYNILTFLFQIKFFNRVSDW